MAWPVLGSRKRLKRLSEVGKEQRGPPALRCTLGFAGTQEVPRCSRSGLSPPRGEWHQGIWFLQLPTNASVKAGRSVAAR